MMLVGGAIALLVLVAGYYAVRSSPVFDVREVAVTGGDPALNAAIQAKTEDATAGRSLLAIDSSSIQRAVEALPTVRSATVDRSFPNALSVSIVMYHPAVAVTTGHHTYLVADDAHVIAAVKQAPAHVVAVALPAGAKLAVGQTSTDRNLAAALWLLRSTPTWFSHKFGRISQVTPRAGTVTATVGSHMQLRLGTPDQLGLKMQVVTRSLGRLDAHDRSTIKYMDVSAPGRPAFKVRS